MTAEEMMRKYNMSPHPENGAFVERHYPAGQGERPASGMIYYYVAAGEKTEFHRIDCDEYWCFSAGSGVELWMLTPDGTKTVTKLGTQADAELSVYIPKGTVFAAKNKNSREGCVVTCITVPRFTYDGFELFEKETVLLQYPVLADFYETQE